MDLSQLTADERMALCIATGVAIEISPADDKGNFIMRTKNPVSIIERGGEIVVVERVRSAEEL